MKITEIQLKDALQRSGYFLETRVLDVLAKNEFSNFPNQTYPDSITNKSRELDIISHSPRMTKSLTLNQSLIFEYRFELIIECVNNLQPIVFFKRPDKNPRTIFGKFYYVKTERKIIESNICADYDFNEFTVYSKLFHYNSMEKNTQYCSFSPKKTDNKEWMASHPDALNDTFGKLNDYLEHCLPSDTEWVEKHCIWRNDVFTMMKFPVLILQNDLFEVSELNGNITLEKKNHIIFEYSKYSEKKDNILIDVITEEYLPNYIKLATKSLQKLQEKIMKTYKGNNIIEITK